MAVAFDAGSESHALAVGSVSEASFSWSHNPVSTPRGVLVFVFTLDSAVDHVSTVTYDGEDVPAVTGGSAAINATEDGRCDVFFLGSGINTTDPATVVVNRTNDAVEMYAVCCTVTAAADTEVNEAGIVLLQTTAVVTEQNVDDGSPGSNSLRFAGGFSGRGDAVGETGANSTDVHFLDTGSTDGRVVRETTAGQGSRPVGFAIGSADEIAAVHLAVREILGASAAITGTAGDGATEAEIVAGGGTIIITLTGDTWVASGATFDGQRQNIINGLDSAQAEGTGWNAEVRDKQGVAGVVRTSDTVVTITLDAQAAYNITATETITVTVPSTAVTGAAAITATPTFTITPVSAVKTLAAMGVG